jgi:hypothetical protein
MIEWFLQPANDNERAISYAMKLYGANQVVDKAVDGFLNSEDKNLDRALKRLQGQKLAREQGLDWERYMSDDSAEENRTTQGAIAYGAKHAERMKPIGHSFAAVSVKAAPKPSEFAEFMRAAKSGASDAFFAPSRALSDLMRDAKAGKVAQNAGKFFRYASFL